MTGDVSRSHSFWRAGRRQDPAGVLKPVGHSWSGSATHRPLQAATATNTSEIIAVPKSESFSLVQKQSRATSNTKRLSSVYDPGKIVSLPLACWRASGEKSLWELH